ncbi:MAG: DUF1003 domain-containing protein [Anaerolineae bacterium]|nr:DUF1003 domain-containing protein [Anaerolineae bacterium]
MEDFEFPKVEYSEYVVRNRNEVFAEQNSRGQKAADWIASVVGSWRFIIFQSILLVLWVVLNVTGVVLQWDPYPFILMNLVLSTEAAFTAPIIMMSQNRQAAKDRLESHLDFETDQKSEREIRMILQQLEAQNRVLLRMAQMLHELQQEKGEDAA